jgi:aminopeptidase
MIPRTRFFAQRRLLFPLRDMTRSSPRRPAETDSAARPAFCYASPMIDAITAQPRNFARRPPARRADAAAIVLADELRAGLLEAATRHVAVAITDAVRHDASSHGALIIADERCELTRLVANAYRAALPDARYVSFDEVTQDEVIAACNEMKRGDLVILVQSLSFRLSVFRIRLELYNRGLKVIEHPHLAGMGEDEIPFYIDALAYDHAYYHSTGHALKKRLDQAERVELHTGASEPLVYASRLEATKLNIGDYTGMINVGGQFPIGEVFTEASDLEAVNGHVRIATFGDINFCVNAPERPITLVVAKGRIVDTIDSTTDFDEILAAITAQENEVWLRELGLGLNRAFTAERRVSDVGSYERMCGVHLSLGSKHNIYPKKQFKRNEAKFHVDVFAATERVEIDGETIYRDGRWQV